MNGQRIKNIDTPLQDNDAVNKSYADALILSAPTEIKNSINTNSKLIASSSELTNGTTTLNMNNQKITSLGAAT